MMRHFDALMDPDDTNGCGVLLSLFDDFCAIIYVAM
jgi:hypothetical protein